MKSKRLLGVLVVALFLVSIAGAASAATLDLPKWVIVPEDSTFSDVTLFCGLDAMDTTNNVTPCYYQGSIVNATIYFNSTTGYPKLVTGRIGNAFEFSGSTGEGIRVSGDTWFNTTKLSIALWFYDPGLLAHNEKYVASVNTISIGQGWGKTFVVWVYDSVAGWQLVYSRTDDISNAWHFVVVNIDRTDVNNSIVQVYWDGQLVTTKTLPTNWNDATTALDVGQLIGEGSVTNAKIDEFRYYKGKTLTPDEIKLLYLVGRKKLSEPAQFRQIFSPMIDLTRDRATFYAGLEVSTSDPNGYVPVPESAVNMSITTAEKLKSDYTGYDFYYQGHYWYRADKIQFNLPIQFETVRSSGNFEKVIILDSDSKQLVFEKEFKVTNPTGARINVIYTVDPAALGFSPLQFPSFELDGVRMAEWRPGNSSTTYLIHTDTLEPDEISTHWIKSTWTLTKQEVEFPASLDDFKEITNWSVAEKLAKNAAEGKSDTYMKVIKIDSTADMTNMTVLVPLNVKSPDDVVEAKALTGSRDMLQVKKLNDGKVVVAVPGDAFVAGHAEIKVLYNKESSFWQRILDIIHAMLAKIKAIFGG